MKKVSDLVYNLTDSCIKNYRNWKQKSKTDGWEEEKNNFSKLFFPFFQPIWTLHPSCNMSYILHDGCVHTCMTKIMTPDITDVMTNVLKSVCTLSCRLHASVLPRWLKKVLTFQSPCGICWSYLQFSNHKTQFVKGKLSFSRIIPSF